MPDDLDFSELLKFPDEVKAEAQKVAEKAYPVTKKFTQQLRDAWRRNARATARKHGKHYPRSITMEQKYALDGPDWEVGPEMGLLQGRMGRGFEYGSRKQPPHLDGTQAATALEPKFEAAVKKIVDGFMS